MVKGFYVIDAHCHIYPEKIAEKAVAATDRFYSSTAYGKGTVEHLVKAYGEFGIDHAIVQSVATTPHQVKSINEFIAKEVELSDGFLTGLGTLHPDSSDIAGDIEHLRELGLKGVKLHPDIQGFKVDKSELLKIYELCEKQALPILMHTGDYRYDNSNPNRVLPILKAYPCLTMIGAHFGGWSEWQNASEIYKGLDNIFIDTSSSLYQMPPDTAARLIREFGVSRCFFGTDYPMWDINEELERFMRVPLTDSEREDILYNNAKNFLNNLA